MKSGGRISIISSLYRVRSQTWRKCLAHPWTKVAKVPAAAVLFATCAAMSGCHGGTQAAEADQGPVPEVTVVKVQRGAIADDLLVSGNIARLPHRAATH